MFDSDDYLDRPDWPLLQNGAVNLFWDARVLADAKKMLAGLNYDISTISGAGGLSDVYIPFSTLLRWEEQFGYAQWNGNLNAFNDALSGYPFGASKRSALILTSFHAIVADDRSASHAILDMLEAHARDHLLFGNILIVLVQTDDSRFECPEIGGRRANWNRRESLPKDRGL